MADHLKRPPPDATDEPLSKRPCPETPETNDVAIKPRPQRRTRTARLTMENLRLLNKMNGASKLGTSKSASSNNSKATRSDKVNPTTEGGFQEILCPVRSIPAHNAKEILDRLNRSRISPPPPEWQYKLYCEKIKAAGNKATVVQRMLPLFRDYDDGKYNINMNRAFSAVLPKGLGFLNNNTISAPQPEFLQGLTRDEFFPFNPSKIPGAVLFKDDSTSTTLPHFSGEWTSRTSDIADATIQNGYAGAVLVYGRNQALEHLSEPDSLGHSAVLTFTSNGEHITFFAHYALPIEGNGTVEYHQSILSKINLTESHESFKRGCKQIRNAQDYAREQSFALRDRLRKHERSQRSRGKP